MQYVANHATSNIGTLKIAVSTHLSRWSFPNKEYFTQVWITKNIGEGSVLLRGVHDSPKSILADVVG